MSPKYLIATHPLPGIPPAEVASVVARGLRSADRSLRSENVLQVPLLDGGESTLEHLVTYTLGSFLEVEATDGAGEQAIVPFGLLGEENRAAFISSNAITGLPAVPETKKRTKIAVPSTGTTFGIGELIQDALDEGARTILIGWDETLVRDAGLGAAAALGVKFFTKDNKQLDLSKPLRDLFSQIDHIDGSGRSMDTLMARYYLLRSENIRRSETETQYSMEDSLFESELSRLAEIVKRDCGKEVNLSKVRMSGSGVDFGLQAFLDTTVEDGGPALLNIAGVLPTLEAEKPRVVIVAESLDQVYGLKSALASQALLKTIKNSELPFDLYLLEPPTTAALSRFRRSYRSLDRYQLLRDAKLFLPPVASTPEEARQNALLRLERLIQDTHALPQAVASA